MTWDSTREYSRDITAYPHRFPTPPTIGGGTDKSVANLFSMEDLHRAICMFYQLISRQLGRTAWIGRTPGTNKATTLRFPGYVNHDLMHLADVPEKDDNPLSVARFSQCGEIGGSICSTRAGRARRRDYVRQQQEEDKHRDGLQRHEVPPDPTEPQPLQGLDCVELHTALLESAQPLRVQTCQQSEQISLQDIEPISVANFLGEIKALKQLHNQPDFNSILERTRQTITNVEHFIPEGDINDFINGQSESDLVREFGQERDSRLRSTSQSEYAEETYLPGNPLDDECDASSCVMDF
jgi:hypothetical protein